MGDNQNGFLSLTEFTAVSMGFQVDISEFYSHNLLSVWPLNVI
jgi:hypothetical protein